MASATIPVGGLALDDSEYRDYQEALRNTPDNANNNLTFVQETPCDFTFEEEVLE